MNRRTHGRRQPLDDPTATVEASVWPSTLRTGFAAFSAQIAGRPLRPYQVEAANAILGSIEGGMGDTFVVMMARQMGKNELSAQLEAWLLDRASETGGTIVKAAPTFRPQLHTSLARLSGVLGHPRYEGKVKRAHGYRLAVGNAEAIFLSASPTAHVAGATASLLLEIDEGQDVDFDKYTRDFRPMAAAANATTVIYGTAWTPDTVVERQREANEARTAVDGRQRNFIYDWTVGAVHNPAYGRFVASEIERLGAGHPLIRTQYLLQALDGHTNLFPPETRLLLRGSHARVTDPGALNDQATYIAGIDVAGGVEMPTDEPRFADTVTNKTRDSTVVTIAEISDTPDGGHPATRVVETYWWTGVPLHEQCDRLVHLVRETWRCQKVVIDASGLGADLASRLQRALGPTVVEPYVFTVATKSRLAYHLLAHVSSGRLQMWTENGTYPSPEAAEFWSQVTTVRPVLRAGNQLGFTAPKATGHDDFVTSLALASWASRNVPPIPAQALLRTDRPARRGMTRPLFPTREGRF